MSGFNDKIVELGLQIVEAKVEERGCVIQQSRQKGKNTDVIDLQNKELIKAIKTIRNFLGCY